MVIESESVSVAVFFSIDKIECAYYLQLFDLVNLREKKLKIPASYRIFLSFYTVNWQLFLTTRRIDQIKKIKVFIVIEIAERNIKRIFSPWLILNKASWFQSYCQNACNCELNGWKRKQSIWQCELPSITIVHFRDSYTTSLMNLEWKRILTFRLILKIR